MSPHRRRIGEPQDDIWKQNEATFRRLYLRERKTLKDVKKAMESEHEFPATPLSTYESKLRDFGLRKKMKRKDWYPVYQHYMNSGRKHTAIYFNSERVLWDKAWKEIRRSGARECNDGHIFGLPADVVMRSPSPGPIAQSATPSYYRLPVPWHLSDVSLVALSPTAMVHRLALYEIPSNLLRMDMLIQLSTRARKEGDTSSYDYQSLFKPTDSCIEPTLSQSSSLCHQSSKHSDVNSDIDELSSAFYRLANENEQPVLPGKPLAESLEIVINKTPKYVLLKILEGDSPTIQVASQKLAKAFSRLSRKDDFFSLIEVICQFHPKRIMHGRYLCSAGRLGCIDSCQLLLQTRRRTKGDPSDLRAHYVAAVLDSIAVGNVECAKIIFSHVFENILADNIFSDFLHVVAKGSYELEPGNSVPYGQQNPVVLHMLEWFFEVGAKVAFPAKLLSARCHLRDPYLPAQYYKKHAPIEWMPTILDYIYFKNFELYSRLIGRCTELQTEVTRSGIHRSASKGIDSVRTYLLSRLSHTPAEQDAFLDTVLTEECLRCTNDEYVVDFNVINTLLDYQIGLQKFRLKLTASAMLYLTVKAASRQGMHPAVYNIVETLIHKGAAITTETMLEAIEAEGITLLKLLSSYDADFKNQGALALCKALRLGNYEAVNRLLEMGVDINATLRGDKQEEEMTILAHANANIFDRRTLAFDPRTGVDRKLTGSLMSCQMLEYLISKNVKPRANLADPDQRHLLDLVIRHGLEFSDFVDTFNKAKVLLDAEPLANDQQRTASCLLEACFSGENKATDETTHQRISFLNYLMDRGISVSHSGVLALLISCRAPESEIRKVLDSGVDVNAYCGQHSDFEFIEQDRSFTPLQAAAAVGSLDWARLLIQRGADVNRPAKGNNGQTALQAACQLESLEEGNSRNIDLIKFLIANGAEVNAPPGNGGFTALQAAVWRVNFEVVLLLLDNEANINAPPAKSRNWFAVDGSVIWGRPDMVQFLLNLGALSYDKGESGYKGAICWAESRGNLPVANMIRHHALKHGKRGRELFSYYQGREVFSSGSSNNLNDTDQASDIWFENEDFWEDWMPL
ncbi:hypothetical protein F4801DRAFT_604011 [Xylaria longipes]|nr:hypothetical protein F4801DRAFT_604011 [Xylaria longipes]